MKTINPALSAAALIFAAWTASAQSTAPAVSPVQAPPAAKAAAAEPAARKGEFPVGETFAIELPCSPTTGYQWELKSVNRRVAAPAGPVEFSAAPAEPGAVGTGGSCVLRVKGLKPGKTKAVLVCRRAWDKGEPAKTAVVELVVVPKKRP
jgi:predicted secreted protein